MERTISPNDLAFFKLDTEPNEQIVAIYPKHWGRILWPLLSLSGLLIATLIVTVIMASNGFGDNQFMFIFFVLVGLWYLSVLTYAISEWYGHNHSAFVITTQRIIDCQQANLWSRRCQSIDIYQIQGCSGELAPGLGVLLGYGDLVITIVGDLPMRIQFLAAPEAVASLVMRTHNITAHQGLNNTHHATKQPQVVEGAAVVEPLRAVVPIHAVVEAAAVGAVKAVEMPSLAPVLPTSSPGLAPVLASIPPSTASVDLKSAAPADPDRLCLILFHVPSENLSAVLDHLPSQREPSIHYLPKTDYYDVQIVLHFEQAQQISQELRLKGAEDIVCQELQAMLPND